MSNLAFCCGNKLEKVVQVPCSVCKIMVCSECGNCAACRYLVYTDPTYVTTWMSILGYK